MLNEKINLRKMRHNKKQVHSFDYILISMIALYAITGLFILYSASNRDAHMVFEQAIRLGFSFLLMFAVSLIDPQTIKRFSTFIYGMTVFLIITVIIFGAITKGAKRWIDVGIFSIQPSEFLLLSVPIMLACYFDSNQIPPKSSNTCIAAALLIIPAILVIKQPDLGTGILILLSGAFILILSGVRGRVFIYSIITTLVLAPLLWHFMHPYQRQRILTFLNPEKDPLGTGYHIIQSKIAIGSGGLFGKGWLHGTQSHLSFLPEHSTDFIFSVAAEELGFIFCLLIIVFTLAIFMRCVFLSYQAKTSFTRILSAGLAINFILCTFTNIAMISGLLPVVGVPLPLISYGGSSVLSTMIGFGIILSCTKHKRIIEK